MILVRCLSPGRGRHWRGQRCLQWYAERPANVLDPSVTTWTEKTMALVGLPEATAVMVLYSYSVT